LSLLEPLYELCRWTDDYWAQMRPAADRFDASPVNAADRADLADPVANTALGWGAQDQVRKQPPRPVSRPGERSRSTHWRDR
jgi:hypothetical protein